MLDLDTRLEFLPLTESLARACGAAILALNADSEWETWTEKELLADFPRKWDLSMLVMRDGVPAAFGICSDKGGGVMHLHHFIVGRQNRGLGIGALFLARLADRGARAGLARMTLKVHTFNEGGIRFYRREGYEILEQSNGYYLMGRTIAVVED